MSKTVHVNGFLRSHPALLPCPRTPGPAPRGTWLQRRPAAAAGKPSSAIAPRPHGAGDPRRRRTVQTAGHRRAAAAGGRRDRRPTTLRGGREGGPAPLGHGAAPPLLPPRGFLRGGGCARSGLRAACRCSVLRPALERGPGRGGTPAGQAGRSGRKVTRVPGRAQQRRAEVRRGLGSGAAEVRSEGPSAPASRLLPLPSPDPPVAALRGQLPRRGKAALGLPVGFLC